MACSSLPMVYVFIESPDLLMILKTCSSTENPPKPNKKLADIILIESDFICTFETRFTPFVNSIIPDNIGFINLSGKWIMRAIGDSIAVNPSKIPLWFNIDMITENITTKPPIIKIVEIAFVMLFPSISPREEKEMALDLGVKLLLLLNGLLEVLDEWLKKRNVIPTVMQARMWLIKSKIPISVLPNKVMPTVPIINNGPELLVKANNLSASSLVTIFWSIKFATILAPTG